MIGETLFQYLSRNSGMQDRDPRYTSPTYLYRYFQGDGRLLYTGISNDFQYRHQCHRDKIWSDYAAAVMLEQFPDRILALIAETISIEDERPDHNARIRLQRRRWPPFLHWYRDKMGGKFKGEDPAWFGIYTDGQVATRIEPPEWWEEPFSQEPLPPEETLQYQLSKQAAALIAAKLTPTRAEAGAGEKEEG